ncbi:DUF4221 domain-containing protein [Polaribacter litorisediminis]|uniref:DUF4221 family protein n=1 Tax=Polaribacter litorisediminis TaxID=1908341 RepID=UPI001CBB8EA1|nr:DUF4221 family protein [Polaribacter litorisediminis]UAM98042.1 DUF4221 domain-containing protein [Polaribacter litorisediminis]
MNKFRLIFIFLILISCSNKNTDFLLEEIQKKVFILDESSSFNIKSSSFFSNLSNKENFSFLNINNNSLVIYEDSIPKIIKLEVEGANGVGNLNTFTSHKILPDNTVALVQSQMGKVFLLSKKGKVLNKFELFNINDRKSFYSFPYNSINNPIIYLDNRLYFTESLVKYFGNYKDVPLVRELSIIDGKTKNIFSLPKVYEENFWGALFKYNLSISKTTNDQQFLISLPISTNLYKIDFKGNILKEIECKSKFIDNIEPMNNDKLYGNKNIADWKKINSYSLTSSDYNSIIFDKFNKLYYRVVYLRPDLDKYISGDRKPDFSIIVLDEKFNVLGEQKFDSNTFSNNFILVSKEGLAIARKDLYEQDNDKLTFSIFKLIK